MKANAPYKPPRSFCLDTKRTKRSSGRILAGVRNDLLYNSNGPSRFRVVQNFEPVWNYTPSGRGIITHSIRIKF